MRKVLFGVGLVCILCVLCVSAVQFIFANPGSGTWEEGTTNPFSGTFEPNKTQGINSNMDVTLFGGTPITIDNGSGNDVGLWQSIARDSKNYLHICYYDSTDKDLKYVTNADDGNWKTPQVVDSTGNVGSYAKSIAVDNTNRVHISYFDNTNWVLKYATNPDYPPTLANWSCITAGNGAGNGIQNYQVSAGPDDGYSDSGGAYDNSGVTAFAGSVTTISKYAWYRFTGVTIPDGATITTAYIKLRCATSGNPQTTIYAEDQVNPSAPTTKADHDGRTRTTAGVNWDPTGYSIGWYQSPDIKTVIQELVDTYNYGSGNSILILHDRRVLNGNLSVNTQENATPPELHIEYT